MKKLLESTNEELLKSKNVLSAVMIVSLIMIIVFSVITFLTGYGSLKVLIYVLIPNMIFCYFIVRKINNELKSREILH